MCWLTPFPGATWFSSTDHTGGDVICKPVDQVAGLGRFTYALWKAWKLVSGLPIPP